MRKIISKKLLNLMKLSNECEDEEIYVSRSSVEYIWTFICLNKIISLFNKQNLNQAPFYDEDKQQWYWKEDIYCNKCMTFDKCSCEKPTYGLPK